MGFFANIINYIKNIDIKKYFKKVIPSKQNIQNLTNKFRKKPRTPDAEYGFISPPPVTVRQHLATPTENTEPIYLQVMERKSVVGIVGPTSRLEDSEEPDRKLGRPSIYTNRTLVGINKLMSHANDKKQRHTIAMPTSEEKRQAPKKPKKRLSHETDDLKVYILDAINEIEMIRHQIHMKSEIVKTIDCNEADLEFVREYLTSCMMEIEDIDAKGTREVESAKEDALYYARQWYNELCTQLESKQDAAEEDIYVKATLAQLDAVKNKLDKLSSEARMKDADNTDVIKRLSQYIDDIEKVNTKAIQKIELMKKETLQLAEELTEHMHDDFVSKRSELLRKSNEDYSDTEIGDEDIYDEVSITSSSENVSIVISDSDSDVDSVSSNIKQAVPSIDKIDNAKVRASQFVIPDILIDSSEVQDIADIKTERNRLSVVHPYLPNGNTKQFQTAETNNVKSETSKSILTDNKLKFVAVDFGNLSSSDLEEDDVESMRNDKSQSKEDYEQISKATPTIAKFGSNSSSSSSQSIPTTKQIKSTTKESPMPNCKLSNDSKSNHTSTNKKPPTLNISHQETIPARRSKEELEFGYTQECLQEILLCRNRLECLADSVHSFLGTSNDDEFVFLQENITFSMMALNTINAKNIKSVQDMKREAMMYGQIWYDELEQKTLGEIR